MAEAWVGYDGGEVQEWHRSASHIRVASNVAEIPEEAFRDCGNLTAVDLSNVTTISRDAFLRCRLLERVVWTTAAAVEIGDRAFALCSSLAEIDLSNVAKIGFAAFGGCHALTSVTIPSSVAEIEADAFANCNNMTEVELCEGIQRIGGRAFYGCKVVVRINIPASVTHIEDEAFYGCESLLIARLNEGLRRIGERAFSGCRLFRISIPSTTLEVGDHAFHGCHQLRDVDLPEGLQRIGRGTFLSCRMLERIAIPASVTSIDNRAFLECNSLAEVTLLEGVLCIDRDAFGGCPFSLRRISIPHMAFVIDMESSSCQLLRGAMPVPRERRDFFARRLVVSKWMQYKSPSQLEQAEAKVNEILGLGQTEDEKIQCIREWFTFYHLLDVTTLLELAIWRCSNGRNERDTEARQRNRRRCGNDMNVIIPGVVEYLER